MKVRLMLQQLRVPGLVSVIVELPDTVRVPGECNLYGDDDVIINRDILVELAPITNFNIVGGEFLYPED
jgi:hypothetical protein